ncbi:hypothetical protein TL16_g03107 [Triparma laevis f. inornata]|uniref:Low temperature requirement A n=1 Tax=Triparma laevis f. inornata TaxID=1714386 RepID=A0A9W7E3A9_9STRA|nr:hypothetical protein TL16_g03107 [Triparma laevis f. inornata]
MVLLHDPPILHVVGPIRRKHKKEFTERFLTHEKAQTGARRASEESNHTSPTGTTNNHDHDPHHEHKAAGWAELFSDLVFVSIIAELSHLIINAFGSSDGGGHRRHLSATDDDHAVSQPFGWTDAYSASVAVILYGMMAWNNWLLDMTYSSRFDRGADVIGRVLAFGSMCSLVVVAGTVGYGFTDSYDVSWAFRAHAVATLFSVAKYARAIFGAPADSEAKTLKLILIPFLVDALFYFIASVEVNHDMENAIYIAFFAQVFRGSLITYNWLAGGLAGKDYYEMSTKIDAHYVTERFGLLSIIVIGESILSLVSGVKASASFGHLDIKTLLAGFIIVFSNWWIYFDNLNMNIVSYHTRGLLIVYLHEALMVSNCFLAAGLGGVLSTAHAEDTPEDAQLLCYSYAVTCTCQFFIRMVTQWSTKAIKQNFKVYCMRLAENIACIAFLFLLGSGCWFEPDRSMLLSLLVAVAFLRVIVDAISTYKDYWLLSPYWDEEGVKFEKPLGDLQNPLRTQCDDMDTSELFRHSSMESGGEGIWGQVGKV